MSCCRYRCALGLAGLLAAAFLWAPQPARAEGKFARGLENAIDELVGLIGMAARDDMPRGKIHGLDNALQQLLRVLESKGNHHHGHHGHHHHGHGGHFGMGLAMLGQGGGAAAPMQGGGNNQPNHNQPANPNKSKAGAPSNRVTNQQPSPPKAGPPGGAKTPAINKPGPDPNLAYILGKPQAKQQGAKTAAPTGAAKTTVTKAAPAGGTIARGVSQLNGAGKHTLSRPANVGPTPHQNVARLGANRQMLHSPWTGGVQRMTKRR